MAVNNPKAQTKEGRRGRDKVVTGLLAAGGAAAIAAGAAAAGPVIAGAAITAGLVGLVVGDQTTVFPIDMIAIPAYQAYMLNGNPQFTVYIKAGETLLPTGGNVDDVEQAFDELAAPMKKKRRKANPWITFNKKFKFRAKRKSESSQAYLTARTRAAKRAYNKSKKGGKK
tara:strand:+ start:71 stop:580 length:510 start_codon:yes stop_codon:yes gene_type:complete